MNGQPHEPQWNPPPPETFNLAGLINILVGLQQVKNPNKNLSAAIQHLQNLVADGVSSFNNQRS